MSLNLQLGDHWHTKGNGIVRVAGVDRMGFWVVKKDGKTNHGYVVNALGQFVDADSFGESALDLTTLHADLAPGCIIGPSCHPGPITMDEREEMFKFLRIDMSEPGYELLADVLQRAYDQAAKGKGKERHACNDAFEDQVMQDGARRFGTGALLFQAFKKSEESQRLPKERGINELLGAIVYLAGAVIRREADGV